MTNVINIDVFLLTMAILIAIIYLFINESTIIKKTKY